MSLPPAAPSSSVLHPSIHPLSHWHTSTDKFQPIGVSQINRHANLRLFLSYWSWAMHVHGHSWCYERCDVSDWIQIGFSGRFFSLATELWFYVATMLGIGNGFSEKSEYFIQIYVENVCFETCICVYVYKSVHVWIYCILQTGHPRPVWIDEWVCVQSHQLSDKIPPDESSQEFIYYLNIFSIRMHLLFLY